MLGEILSLTIVKYSLSTLLVLIIVCVAGVIYAVYVEPKSLVTTRHQLEVSGSLDKQQDLTIVQFSDTHVGPHFSLAQLKVVVTLINEQKPDLIMFTGDLLDRVRSFKESKDELIAILAELNAPLGKFAVYGNHDRGGGGSAYYQQVMEQANFDLLVNDVRTISLANNKSITIAGLDDFLLGKPKVEETLEPLQQGNQLTRRKEQNQSNQLNNVTSPHSDTFVICLVHEPDVADRIVNYPVDLQLSGHSHGGQVQVPLLGPVVTPSLARKYKEGLYEIHNENNTMKLYVNRGIGTTRLPIRLGSTPEISIFTLKI
ncbi:metallophosphoesterase [Brevibacillus laterosporus]|uniref:metallophosphoesterase n=1 Tax=Brevibacillus laterosporus TaxID=1465 RepID=UPI0018CED9FD|nr:metallophosphoesterase [Brevibacillus laterosporus]MBG9789831.1 metallophosphoesterase [Brevibacillus laterosporus]